MNENEQIQEMSKILDSLCWGVPDEMSEHCGIPCSECKAKRLYSKGYRKVERGEWKPYPKIRGKVTPEAVCSRCGCMCVYLLVNDRYELAHYCPKCGVDMRGGRE